MSKIPLRTTGKQDPTLQRVLEMVDQAVETFVEALPKMEHRMDFRAISVRKFMGEDAAGKWESFQDLLSAAVVRALEDHRELVEEFEMDMSHGEEDGYHVVWLHARRREQDIYGDFTQAETEE